MANWKRWLILTSLALSVGASVAGECGQIPISVVGSYVSGDTLGTTMTNSQSFSANGYLHGRLQAGGRSIYFYSPVELGANETITYEVRFSSYIGVVLGLDLCANKPGGISDAPDPILIEATRKEEDEPK